MTVLPPKGVCYADGCAVKLTPGRTYCGVHFVERARERERERRANHQLTKPPRGAGLAWLGGTETAAHRRRRLKFHAYVRTARGWTCVCGASPPGPLQAEPAGADRRCDHCQKITEGMRVDAETR